MAARRPLLENPAGSGNVPLLKLPRTLFDRKWWWVTFVVLAGMIVLARLGIWQLDRLDQRRARNTELAAQLAADPLDLNADVVPVDPAVWRDRAAQARGTFDVSNQLLLTQQNWQGQPGAHLITPMLLDGRPQALLIDRGWVPAADVDAGRLAQFDPPTGVQSVKGAVQLSQTLSNGRQDTTVSPHVEWYRVDIAAIQSQMPYQLLPLYVLQAPASDSAAQQELPYRLEPEVDLSEGPHLAYAIQWFLFALMLGAGYLRFVSVRGA